MQGSQAATWGIAAIATFGVIVRPWNLPEFICCPGRKRLQQLARVWTSISF